MNRPEYELISQLRSLPRSKVETKIPIIEEDEASGDAVAAYAYFRQQTGREDVPGILKCFGTNPVFLRQMIDISASLLFGLVAWLHDGYVRLTTRRAGHRR